MADQSAGPSIKEQVANVVKQETELLKQGRALRIQIDEAERFLANLRAQEREIDLNLTKVSHVLDGIGLGQRYLAEQQRDAMLADAAAQEAAAAAK